MSGGKELIDYAVTVASKPSIGGILHWGQRNDWSRAEVERIYGESSVSPGGRLRTWRTALACIAGDRDGFSSEFTRRAGLEAD